MGFCMNINDCDFVIKAENKNAAMNALHNLAKKNKHLSWVSSDSVLEQTTFEDTIEEFGWSGNTAENGDIVDMDFIWEKYGDEDIFFQEIAPFIEVDSYIQMSGEDGSIWRWVFDGKNCKEINPTINW